MPPTPAPLWPGYGDAGERSLIELLNDKIAATQDDDDPTDEQRYARLRRRDREPRMAQARQLRPLRGSAGARPPHPRHGRRRVMAPGVGDGRTYSVAPSPARRRGLRPGARRRAGVPRSEGAARTARPARCPGTGSATRARRAPAWAGRSRTPCSGASSCTPAGSREDERLSPRFIWMAAKEMRAKKTVVKGAPEWQPTTFLEQGVSDAKSALAVARTFGAALEHDLPFHGHLYPGDVDRFYDRAGRQKIDAYYRLDPEGAPIGLTAGLWRRWIHQHGPVLLVVQVDRAFVDGPPVLDAFDARLRRLHARRRDHRLRAGRASTSAVRGARAGARRATRSPPRPTWKARCASPTGSSCCPTTAERPPRAARGRARG